MGLTTKERKPSTETIDIFPQTVEEYVAEQFPLGTGEHQVKYCSVGENRFRINFYTRQSESFGFGTYNITRSHYVICSEKDGNWSHRIWEDDNKPSLESGNISQYL